MAEDGPQDPAAGLKRECGRRGHESATTDYRLVPGSLFNQIEDVRAGLRLFMDDTGFI
jgi:hypothetical protein